MPKLYAPHTPSRGQPVEVDVLRDGLRVAAPEAPSETVPYPHLVPRLEGDDDAWVVLAHQERPGWELWLERQYIAQISAQSDHLPRAFADRWAALRTTDASRRSGRAFGLFGGLGCLTLLVGGVCSGVWMMPVLNFLPLELDEQLGQLASVDLLAGATRCNDKAATAAVQTVLDRLTGALDDPPFTYQITLIDDPTINAFALPGGYMIVHSALLADTTSPDELAAVLGHELTHTNDRHGMRALAQNAGIQVLFATLLGDASTAVQVLAAGSSQLQTLQFSREQEREADERGVRLMNAAGYDPQAAASFHARMAADEGELERALSWVSTHPASADRVTDLSALATELGHPNPHAPDDAAWTELRGRCMVPVEPVEATPEPEAEAEPEQAPDEERPRRRNRRRNNER